MFSISRRRRNIFLACGAVVAGGYVAYRVYNSRKRIRVLLFFQSLSSLLEALAQGSDSLAALLGDVHGYLISEEDEVPRPLKQLMKLAGSREAQESISAFSAAVSRGVLSTLLSGGSVALGLKHEEHPRALGSSSSRVTSPWNGGYAEETKDVIKLGGKDIVRTQEGSSDASTCLDDRALSPDEEGNSDEFWRDCNGVWDDTSWTSTGNVLEGVKAQVDSSIVRGAKEALQEGLGGGSNSSRNEVWGRSGLKNDKEELVDRLAEKLFSESGKSFVSAVVASASRSFVFSVLEHSNSSNGTSGVEEAGSGSPFVKGLVAFANTAEGRLLLTDYIQTFVGTAVSVYLDRTKDINTFDELVAGLVKPEHKGPITDLLTTVCKASASSFVRTSHEVLRSGPSSSRQLPALKTIQSSLDSGDYSYRDNEDTEVLYDLGEQVFASPNGKSVVAKRDEVAPIDLIQSISKVLAVPSNRKLILDIAGTMTSEGVRSVIDVSLGKVTAVLTGKGKEHTSKDQDSETIKRSAVGEKLQYVGDMTKAAMDKSRVLMTMCFAVCLHSVVGGVRMFQPI